jgi:drug/metabolite transporter (DMT)-like permease
VGEAPEVLAVADLVDSEEEVLVAAAPVAVGKSAIQMEKREVHGLFYAFGAMLLWGLSFAWSKLLLELYSPVIVIFIRLLISVVFLFSYLIAVQKISKVNYRDLKRFALLSFFLPFLYFLGENYGIQLTTATTAALIIATIPIFIVLIALIWFKETLTLLNISGIFISFIGVGFIVYENSTGIHGSINGILWLFMAVASAIIYTIFIKDMSQRYNAIYIIAIQNLFGVIYFIPLLFFESDFEFAAAPRVIYYFLALAILCSSIAYIFYVLAVKNIGMAKTEAFANLIPVIAAVYSFFLLNEVFGVYKITGILLVISGLFFSQMHNLKKKKS